MLLAHDSISCAGQVAACPDPSGEHLIQINGCFAAPGWMASRSVILPLSG
jgi:predicted amidohydrolase